MSQLRGAVRLIPFAALPGEPANGLFVPSPDLGIRRSGVLHLSSLVRRERPGKRIGVYIGNRVAVGEDHPMDLESVRQGVLQLRQGDAVSAGYARVAGPP
jgi:hypothetical protein